MFIPRSEMNEEKIKTSFESKVAPVILYSADNDKFWMVDGRGKFVGYRKGAVSGRLEFEYSYNELDRKECFAHLYRDCVIDCVTAIGGWKKGLHEIGSKKVLVPYEQRRIKPVKGEWEIMNKLLLGMFGQEQFEYYKGWLKTWLASFYNYKFTPGQVLILVGETSSGKTLLKDIHNHIFDGGGQPLKYMTGGTGFNGELCEVCSLHIDDKLNDLGDIGKKKLKAECKEISVAGQLRFEAKNKTAFNASPCFRLLICCNYTEDSVTVIPDIDESTKNKISILNCKRNRMPMPSRKPDERAAFWKQIESEMPAFLYHVIHEHEITEEFADLEEERMGVRGYHNEKAMKFVETHSNEGKRLFAMIEALRLSDSTEDEWCGSAGELMNKLNDKGIEKRATATSIGRFLNQRIACGSKLVKKVGQRRYTIDLTDNEDVPANLDNEIEKNPIEDDTKVTESQEELFEDEDEENYYGHP